MTIPSAAHDQSPGADEKQVRFGRFDVVRELGKGGMAKVYEGLHSELGKRVALKVMQPAVAAQPVAAERFVREAKAAAQIRHPNVVEVFDIGTEKGVPFIVMEFLEGSNLAEMLGEKGPLSISGIAEVFLPVISAVATAHAAGIVHRDLKPANLMLTSGPLRGIHPVVLDFGISKFTSEELDSSFTSTGSVLGTVQYMAPELTRGAKFASPASDQYALGVMLYECAIGQRPFSGASHYEVMHAIVTSPVVPPSRLNPSLPPAFDDVVARAMHRDPSKRFSSVLALGSALLCFADKRNWALWERAFMDSPGPEPWQGSTQTVRDEKPTARERQSKRRRFRPQARHLSWVVLPLAAYAAWTTFLLTKRTAELDKRLVEPGPASVVEAGDRPSDDLLRSGAPAESEVATSPKAAPLVLGEANPRAGPSPIDLASESATRLAVGVPKQNAVPPIAASPPSRPMPSDRRGQVSVNLRSATSPAQGASVPPALSATPKPAVFEGHNGAPILD